MSAREVAPLVVASRCPFDEARCFLCKGSAVCAVSGRLPHTAETVGVSVMALQRAEQPRVWGGCVWWLRPRTVVVGMPMADGRPMDASGVMPATLLVRLP